MIISATVTSAMVKKSGESESFVRWNIISGWFVFAPESIFVVYAFPPLIVFLAPRMFAPPLFFYKFS